MGVRRAEHTDLARAEAARAASVRPEQTEGAAPPPESSPASTNQAERAQAVQAQSAQAQDAQTQSAQAQVEPVQIDSASVDPVQAEPGQDAAPADKQRAPTRAYQPRARRRRSRGSFLLSLLLFVLTVVASYELFVLVRNFTQDSRTFPVARVVISGELKYISEEEIASTVGKLVGGKNLVTLDLSRLHNALVQMPWMAKVAVSKRFPDTIEVQVVEHSPSARWRTSGVYDSTTDSVFYPDLRGIDLPLVILSAPHDSLAGDLYQHAAQFIALCARTPYFIKEVHLDAVRGYRIRLEGDVWLILGRETSANLPLIRLKRFLLAFPQTQLKLSEISYVDLRYDNGFAVGERDPNFNGVTGTSTPPPEAAAEEQSPKAP